MSVWCASRLVRVICSCVGLMDSGVQVFTSPGSSSVPMMILKRCSAPRFSSSSVTRGLAIQQFNAG